MRLCKIRASLRDKLSFKASGNEAKNDQSERRSRSLKTNSDNSCGYLLRVEMYVSSLLETTKRLFQVSSNTVNLASLMKQKLSLFFY